MKHSADSLVSNFTNYFTLQLPILASKTHEMHSTLISIASQSSGQSSSEFVSSLSLLFSSFLSAFFTCLYLSPILLCIYCTVYHTTRPTKCNPSLVPESRIFPTDCFQRHQKSCNCFPMKYFEQNSSQFVKRCTIS